MIREADEYFSLGCGRCARFATADCSTRFWEPGLRELRGICLAENLEESVRWAHPCYRHAGRNIAILGALRNDFRISFFDAALLHDDDGVLERQGPNTRHPDMIRFRDPAEVAAKADAVRLFLRQAIRHAEAGHRPPRTTAAPDIPPVLVEALNGDPELAEAFQSLTPGRQRSYAITLGRLRTAAAQIGAIARLRPAILAGKGAQER